MKVSIVIPCLNEEAYIEKCVLSVLRSDYDMSNVEIFVCDGLSDDGTRTIVQELEEKHKNVHLLINEHRTTPYALNLGLKRGTGAIKFILGAHAEVDPGYISNSVQVLHDKPEVGCVGGVLDNLYSNEVARSIGIAMASRFGVGGSKFRTGAKDGYVDTVGFGAYRQEVFEKVGYFDEELTRNQDDEFNYRVNQAGIQNFPQQ